MMDDKMMRALENDRFAAYVGIRLIKVEEGYALAQMEISDKHLNGLNMVQGGAMFTLADYAFAAAANSKGQVTVSVNANMTFFSSPKGKILTAEAKEISTTKKLCGYNVDVLDERKKVVARLAVTGYIKG